MKLRQYLWLFSIVAYVGMVTVNILADRIPIGGRTTGEVSAMYPTLVTPAAYAFAIWGLIYTLLAGFVIVQALPRFRDNRQFQAIAPWFILQSVFNSVWIVYWHNLKLVSSVWIMLALLVTLIVIYHLTRQIRKGSVSRVVRFWVQIPFSVYLAWISVATILNISVTLTAYDWNGWGISEVIWASFVLVLAALLAFLSLNKEHDIAFALVIVWALIAIGVNQWDETLFIAALAFVLSLFILLFLSYQLVVRIRKKYI